MKLPHHTCICCCLVTKLCPTLCNPMNCYPPGSSVHGISKTRILGWVAISFSRGSARPRGRTHPKEDLLHRQADSVPLSPRGSPDPYLLIVWKRVCFNKIYTEAEQKMLCLTVPVRRHICHTKGFFYLKNIVLISMAKTCNVCPFHMATEVQLLALE